MEIRLANTRGFCAGVDRAIEIVKKVLEIQGSPVYVKHEVVHNKTVVEELKQLGAIFVEDIKEIPEGEVVVYSAHGISKAVEFESEMRKLDVFDATCPLVSKVHAEVNTYAKMGFDCLLIGHKNHPEVEGTMGQYDHSSGGDVYLVEDEQDVLNLQVKNPNNLAFVTQTTLSMDDTSKVIDALRHKFPNIEGPRKDDICYATQNRQDAVKQLALEADVVLVVGSPTSSNSNRLRELAERCGCDAYLIDGAEDIQQQWIEKAKAVGVTAGASAPEVLVSGVIERLVALGVKPPKELDGVTETISFSLPRELRG